MEKYNKKHPLRVVTLCSGYDSQCMALDRMTKYGPKFAYELVAWSEIDKNAITAHNLVYPQWKDRNLGDMTKIDWSKAPDFDFLTYSTPCQDFSNAGLQMGGGKKVVAHVVASCGLHAMPLSRRNLST